MANYVMYGVMNTVNIKIMLWTEMPNSILIAGTEHKECQYNMTVSPIIQAALKLTQDYVGKQS